MWNVLGRRESVDDFGGKARIKETNLKTEA
jgi:hypothetical protein